MNSSDNMNKDHKKQSVRPNKWADTFILVRRTKGNTYILCSQKVLHI